MKIWYNIGLCSQFAYKILDEGARLLRLLQPILLSHDRSINELALHNRNNFQHCSFTDLPERGEIPGLGIARDYRNLWTRSAHHDFHLLPYYFLQLFLYLVLPVNTKEKKRKRKERHEGKRRFFRVERFTRSNDTRTNSNYSSSSSSSSF